MNRYKKDELITDVYRAKLVYEAEMRNPEYREEYEEEFEFIGKALYAKGYRKSTDVAREIFEEIDSLLESDENDFDNVFEDARNEGDSTVSLALSNYVYGIRKMFAELKKKFTESEKDDGKSINL